MSSIAFGHLNIKKKNQSQFDNQLCASPIHSAGVCIEKCDSMDSAYHFFPLRLELGKRWVDVGKFLQSSRNPFPSHLDADKVYS